MLRNTAAGTIWKRLASIKTTATTPAAVTALLPQPDSLRFPCTGRLSSAAFFSVYHTGLPGAGGPVSQDDRDVLKEFEPLRSKARKLKRSQSSHFLKLAREGLGILGRASKGSRFRFPHHLCFLDVPSPVAGTFDLLLATAFLKSHDARFDPDASENNQSGFALGGRKGVGKSRVLRLVATLAPLLLDNVLSVYMDAQSFEEDEATRPKPWQLLRAAILQHGISTAMHFDRQKVLTEAAAESDSIRDLLSVCEGTLLPFFILDELSHVYRDSHTWHNLCTMATSCYAYTVVADSTSRLDSMVKRTDDERLKKWFGGTIQESLNDTKLRITRLFPLSERRQYKTYMEHRSPSSNLDIDGAHLITGGKLGDVAALVDNSVSGDDVAIAALPPVGTPERHVLMAFVKKQGTVNALNEEGRFDPFRLATIDIAAVCALLEKCDIKCNPDEVVAGMLETELLARAPKVVVEENDSLIVTAAPHEAAHLTFGSPAHYLLLTQLAPRVYLSYASEESEKAIELRLQLERYQLRVSTDKDPRVGWHGWMEHEAAGRGQGQGSHRFCTVLLTKSYVESLLVGPSGCSVEVDSLRSLFDSEQHRKRLLLVAPDGVDELLGKAGVMQLENCKWLCKPNSDGKLDSLVFNDSQLGSLVATIFALTTAVQ